MKKHVSIVLAICSLFFAASCKSKTAVESTKSITTSAKFELQGSLLSKVPPDTIGFVEWNTTSDAYRRFAASPWAASDLFSAKNFTQPGGEVPRYISVLQKAGLDPYDRTVWEGLFSRAVFFVSPAGAGTSATTNPFIVSLYFQSSPKTNLGEKLSALREQLTQASVVTEDEAVEGAKAFRVNTDQFQVQQATNPPTKKPDSLVLYVGWKGSEGVVSSTPEALKNVLGGKYSSLPELVKGAQFDRGTKDFPSPKDAIGLGYFDIAQGLKRLPKTPQNSEALAAAEKFPFTSLSFISSMTDVPNSYGRLVYQPVTDEQKQWFAALSASVSQGLLPALPANPLIFFSIDGKTIEHLKELALKQAGDKPELTKQLAVLSGLKRVGIAARVSGVGQSILPFPDVVVIIESDNAQGVKDSIVTVASTLSSGAQQGGQLTWSDKTIASTPVKAMTSPLGIGLFIANVKNLVIASSSEQQLTALLANLNAKPGTQFPTSVNAVLASEPNVGNFYVNFQEVGNFMENMGGLLAMYAPPGGNGKKLIDPQSIEKVKKMGMIVGSVTVDPDSIGFKTFYQLENKKVSG